MNKLNVTDRDLKVKTKTLRSQGIIPGILFGKDFEQWPIQMSSMKLSQNLTKDGEIYEVKSKDRSIFVKFNEVQRDPVTHKPIHFSLLHLPKGVMSTVSIPINFEGSAKGVEDGGSLMQLMQEISLEAMPSKMPEMLNVDISHLNIGDKITVADIDLDKTVKLLDDPTEVVAVVVAPTIVEEVAEEESFAVEGEDNSAAKVD